MQRGGTWSQESKDNAKKIKRKNREIEDATWSLKTGEKRKQIDTASGGHIQGHNFAGPGAQKAKKKKERNLKTQPGAQKARKKKRT